jgi:protein ImuB
MLWACLRFPALPLVAVFADVAAGALPCALTEGPRQRPLIAQANAAARQRGVRVGQPVAAARALCAEVQLLPRDHASERASLELLAAWAYRFSGQVSIGEPATLWLEIGASLTLFGGWPALERRLRDELRELGHGEHLLAVAPVAATAEVLAVCRDGIAIRQPGPMLTALGQAPIAHSGLEPAAIALLCGMGLRYLRDVFALPRAELARRAGPATVTRLDLLRGMAPEALALYRPPDRFARRIELDGHIDSWQPLLFPLRRLTRDLALFLLARDGGVERFELVLEHEGRAATRIDVGLLSAQRDADDLYQFGRGRLERAQIPAEVEAIALNADDLPPFRPRHRDLFDTALAEGVDWPTLTERLRARLGDEALRGLACVAEHRPERAWRYVAAPVETPPEKSKKNPSGKKIKVETRSLPEPAAATPPRPLWLLPRPIPLRPKPAQILAGPERIESGWWDGDDARRDYYVVRCANGQRAWAYLPAGGHDEWMLHGWFA